jgi:hypothetical protein
MSQLLGKPAARCGDFILSHAPSCVVIAVTI